MRTTIAAAICLIATTAEAQHPVQSAYEAEPCMTIIATLDATPGNLDQAAKQAMIWGYMLAIDAIFPTIKTAKQTTLERLRAACAETPNRPALEILKGLAEQ